MKILIKFLKDIFRPIVFFPLEHPIWWKIVKYVAAMPGILLFTFITYSTKVQTVVSWQESFKNIFDKNWKTLLLLIVGPSAICFILELYESFAAYYRRDKSPLKVNENILALLGAIRLIIGKKMDRFGCHCIKIKNSPSTVIESFNTITQPVEQIKEIITQLTMVLKRLVNSEDIEVVLVSIKNNTPKEFVYHYPPHKRPNEGILTANPTFFTSILDANRFIFIPDIEKHNSNMAKLRGLASKITYHCPRGCVPVGSIAGIPIVNNFNQEVIYLLTIKSDKPNTIDKNFESGYNEVIDEFINRILLEHYLQEIKENVTR